jgi:hypothetical protein
LPDSVAFSILVNFENSRLNYFRPELRNRSILLVSPDRMCRHLRLKPLCDLVRVKPDRTSHAKKRNPIVLDLLVQSSNADTKQTGEFFYGKSFFSGAQLLDERHGMWVSREQK